MRSLEEEIEDLEEELERARWALRSSERAGAEGRVTNEDAHLQTIRDRQSRVRELEIDLRELQDVRLREQSSDGE